MWMGNLASRRGIGWSSGKLGTVVNGDGQLGLMLTWSGFRGCYRDPSLVWTSQARPAKPLSGDDCSQARLRRPSPDICPRPALSLLAAARATKKGRRKEPPFRSWPVHSVWRGKTSKRKFGWLASSRPASLPPSTPPLDSAAHHIATRQIRASCSISTVPTLVNSAIMGAEKDGFPAVPLRTAQTLNSTVVWAVSEAPNIFTSPHK